MRSRVGAICGKNESKGRRAGREIVMSKKSFICALGRTFTNRVNSMEDKREGQKRIKAKSRSG